MKKFFMLVTATLLISGATFATDGGKKKSKAKHESCAKGKTCSKSKAKMSS